MTNSTLLWTVEMIQTLPHHHCPICSAAGIETRFGFYLPFQDLFGGPLREVQDQFGYVRFDCTCPHAPGPGLRVARLGEMILPLPFLGDQAGEIPNGVINARRVLSAIHFMSCHAGGHPVPPFPIQYTKHQEILP